jgi:type VI secretion system protein VasJ
LLVGRLAIQAGKADLARSLLEGLVSEGDRHQLDEWEPTLAASLYSALLAAWGPEREASDEDRPARVVTGPPREEVFARLCRLDPAAALKLSGR